MGGGPRPASVADASSRGFRTDKHFSLRAAARARAVEAPARCDCARVRSTAASCSNFDSRRCRNFMRSALRARESFSASFASRRGGPAILLLKTSSSAASWRRSAHNLLRCASKSRAVVSRASQSACRADASAAAWPRRPSKSPKGLPLLLDDWGRSPMEDADASVVRR